MATPTRRAKGWLLLATSGLSLLVAWVLASPIGASPDEPAHIWYAWGTVTGQTLTGEHLVTLREGWTATTVRVPEKLLQHPEPGCYAGRPAMPVTPCVSPPADTMRTTTKSSYMSGYPPLFYGVEGAVLRGATAVNLSGPRVLYGARLAAATLSMLAVAFGVFLLSRRFPVRVVLFATLLGLPPAAWSLAAGVNPNGLETTAAFLLAAAVLSIRFDSSAGVRSTAAVLAVPLGTLLLAWTRPLSWVWAALILGLLLVPTGRREGEGWRQRLPVRKLGAVVTAATALILLSSMVWFGYAYQLRNAQASVNPASWTGLNVFERVVVLLFGSGSLISDQIGFFGWDTALPSAAVLVWVSIAGVAVAVWFSGRTALVPRWAVGAILGLGYLTALLDEYRAAWSWQGRYLLPITAAVCVLAIPGLANGLGGWIASRRVVPWLLSMLVAVNALSVVWFLWRNAYGVRDWPKRLPSVPLPLGTPSWTPPPGQGVVLALVVLSLACGVAAMWVLRPESKSAEDGDLMLPGISVGADAPLRSSH